MTMKKTILALLLFFTSNSLRCEVEQIKITWNAVKCQNSCIRQIKEDFSAIKEVTHFDMNPDGGEATMNWNPNTPFSYEPFRYAAAAVGISINSMRLTVIGTLSHDADNIYLISKDDGSRFQLLPPIQTNSGRYTNRSMANYPFSPQTRQELLDLELKRAVVKVSGPMYLPSFKPNVLIIERLSQIDPTAVK